MYNLNPNSLTSRFYSWLWDTDVRKFKNMCPYFWKYVFTITFLPLVLIIKGLTNLPTFNTPKSKTVDSVVKKVNRSFDKVTSYHSFWYKMGKLIKWLFVGIYGLVVLACIIFILHLVYTYPHKALETIRVLTIVLLVISFIVYQFTTNNLWDIIKKPFVIIGDMIYNLYKNACPMLTWQKETES